MKEKVQDNLYYVEKIIRLEEIDGKMYGVVKWENYSFKEITLQPLESLKLNPQLEQDIEKMEAEFEIRHLLKAINHQVEQYTKSYLEQLYKPINTQSSQGISPVVMNKPGVNAIVKQDNEIQIKLEVNKSQHKQKQQLTIPQLVICNIKAKNRVKQLIKYGLANFRPNHYFQLFEILYDVSQLLNKDNSVRKTDLVVQQIKGFYIEEHSYKFCLLIAGRVIVVPMAQMMQKFPQNLFNFLVKFLRYARQIMSQQIKKEQQVLTNKRYKAKAIQSVSKMLNIRQNIQSSKRKVYFGRHDQDVQLNIKIQHQRFLGTMNNEDNNKSSKEKKTKKDEQSNDFTKDLKVLYEEIEALITKALNIDRNSKQDSKSQSAKSKISHKKSKSQNISQKVPNSEYKSAGSKKNNDQMDSFQSLSSRARKRSTKKNASGNQVPDELQPRRSKRISSRSVTVRKASRNEDNPNDESELSSEEEISTDKKRKNSVDKNSTARSGKKKIFKKN